MPDVNGDRFEICPRMNIKFYMLLICLCKKIRFSGPGQEVAVSVGIINEA
jgi:hypothetical protein